MACGTADTREVDRMPHRAARAERRGKRSLRPTAVPASSTPSRFQRLTDRVPQPRTSLSRSPPSRRRGWASLTNPTRSQRTRSSPHTGLFRVPRGDWIVTQVTFRQPVKFEMRYARANRGRRNLREASRGSRRKPAADAFTRVAADRALEKHGVLAIKHRVARRRDDRAQRQIRAWAPPTPPRKC